MFFAMHPFVKRNIAAIPSLSVLILDSTVYTGNDAAWGGITAYDFFAPLRLKGNDLVFI